MEKLLEKMLDILMLVGVFILVGFFCVMGVVGSIWLIRTVFGG